MALPIKKQKPPTTTAQQQPSQGAKTPDTAAERESLINRYRPRALADVVGQDAIVASLQQVLASKNVPHAFLFTGPSGTGKTTLARIVALRLGIPKSSLMEVDGGTHSGAEAMRNVIDKARSRSMQDVRGRRFLIVDEAHALSATAWTSMLKAIEEPPEHVYWAFCTTNTDKVPKTIRTRCVTYNLNPVANDTIQELLEKVADAEKIDISNDLLGLLSRTAAGSVRQALSDLNKIAGTTNKKAALQLLHNGVSQEADAIDLARMLCGSKNNNWAEYMRVCGLLVDKVEKSSPEGVRLVIINYACAVLREAKDPNRMLAVLHAFREPFHGAEGWAPMYRALGELLL